MNHYDEMTCLLYLDGQLERERAAELERHAAACAECGRLLNALKLEGGLLHQAMAAKSEAVPARLQDAPWAAQPIPWGWLTGLGFAALGAYTVWVSLLEPGLEQLNLVGLSEKGLFAVLLLGGVFWKGWGSLMTIMNVLAGVSIAGLLLLAWRRMASRSTTLAMVMSSLLLLTLLPAPAAAAELKKEESYVLAEGETVKNDLIVIGRTIRIDGRVEGDLIAVGQRLTVSGEVTGDVIFAGQEVRIEGKVGGNVRVAGNNLTFNGETAKNISAFGGTIAFDSKAQVGGGVMTFSGALDLDGRITRDVLAFFDEARFNGFVGGSVESQGKTLSIGSSTEILGKTVFKGQKAPKVSEKAKLGSAVDYQPIVRKSQYADWHFYWQKLIGTCAVFLVGLVMLLLFPEFFREVQTQQNRYGLAFGTGLVTFIAVPILAFLAVITYVGFALGLATFLIFVVIAYSAQTFVALWIGQRLLGQTTSVPGQLGRLALGLLIIRTVWNIPEAFIYVACIVTFWGLGAIVLALGKRFQRQPIVEPPAMAQAA